MLLELLLILLVIFIFINFRHWRSRGIPGPKIWPQFKRSIRILVQSKNRVYEWDEIYQEFKTKYRFVGIFDLFSPTIFVLDPTLMKEILTTHFTSFRDTGLGEIMDKHSEPIFGRLPSFVKGGEWRQKRLDLINAFTTERFKVLYKFIEEANIKMVEYAKKNINQNEMVNVKELASKFTLQVISSSIYSQESGAFDDVKSEMEKMADELLKPSFIGMFKFAFLFFMPFLKTFIKVGFTSKRSLKYLTELMDKALAIRKANNNDSKDILDFFIQLQLKKQIDGIDLTAQGAAFFFNGYETSSFAIAHALFELSRNQRIQNKLRAELNEAVAQHGSLTFDLINKQLPYLEQVFGETLRLHPPAVGNHRICTEDIELEYENGKKALIEKGTFLNIPIWSVQRDEQYYENPEEFYPERFDDGGLKEHTERGLFQTFGLGPRICLGLQYANIQSRACIAAIVQNFELTLNEKTKVPLVLDPKQYLNLPIGGLWVDFKEIKKTNGLTNAVM